MEKNKGKRKPEDCIEIESKECIIAGGNKIVIITLENGTKEYHLNGKIITKEEYNKIKENKRKQIMRKVREMVRDIFTNHHLELTPEQIKEIKKIQVAMGEMNELIAECNKTLVNIKKGLNIEVSPEDEIKEFVADRLLDNMDKPSTKEQLLDLITLDLQKGEVHTKLNIDEISCLTEIIDQMELIKIKLG